MSKLISADTVREWVNGNTSTLSNILRDPYYTIDAEGLRVLMEHPDLNMSRPAWNVAFTAAHPDQVLGGHASERARSNITPEQYDALVAEATKGFAGPKMTYLAAGMVDSSVPLSDEAVEAATDRVFRTRSPTALNGLMRRMGTSQLSTAQANKLVDNVDAPTLLLDYGMKGWSPTPEQSKKLWDQLAERAKDPGLLDTMNLQGAIENYFSYVDNIPKEAFDSVMSRTDGGAFWGRVRKAAIRKTPHPEHYRAILDAERKFQAEGGDVPGQRPGWHGRRDIEALINNQHIPRSDLFRELEDVLPEIFPARLSGVVKQDPALQERLHKWAHDHNDSEMGYDLFRNEASTPEQTAKLFERWPRLRHRALDENSSLAWSMPDHFAESRIGVAFGTNKMRQVRDLILSKGKTELSPKELPAGNWGVARLPNGNISAKLLQEAIDSAPRVEYNITHGDWDGAQRHSQDSSNVFQLNITQKQVEQLKEAGVYDQFKNMHEASRQGGHPLGPTGLGWVRWTGGKDGIFMDEVQSDFGQSFVKKARAEAEQYGYDPEDAAARAHQEYGDEGTFQKIKDILFGGKHPSEVLQEAFHEWLRTPHKSTPAEISENGRKCTKCGKEGGKFSGTGPNGMQCAERPGAPASEGLLVQTFGQKCGGEFEYPTIDYVGTPVHIWQPEAKATISLSSTENLPGHFLVGYRDVPKKMGLKPGEYGELPTQFNVRHKSRVFKDSPKYVRDCDSCSAEIQLDQDQYNDGYHRGTTCPSCGIKQSSMSGFTLVGADKVTPGKATWKDEIRKSEDQREHRPNNAMLDHALPDQLEAEGYRLSIGHAPGLAIATVHRGGKVLGRVRLVDWEPHEEWLEQPHRVGLRTAVLRALEGHAKGEPDEDGWSRPTQGPKLLSKAEPGTLKPQAPLGFHAQPDGHHVTAPHQTYSQAAAAKPKGQAYEGGKNVWVRPHHESSNAGRTLMVQFSSDLLQGNRQKDHSDAYYDNLYSKRQGYQRPDDWWEVPQWQAHLAHSLPHTDHYTVRDPAEAIEFMKHAGYKNVAFSSLDVTAPFIKHLAQNLPEQKFVVGGYTDMGMYAEHPNVDVHPSVQSFVESEGHEYKPGFDYRHFNGVKVIPRLTLSDGCRHNCTFCCVPKKVVETPMSTVEQQADAFGKDLNAELVYLNDKTFGQAPNHANLPALYQRIRAKNPAFKGFIIQTTAAQMKRFTPEFIRDAGIRHIELGIESVNDNILRAHKKPANEALINDAAAKVRQAGASLIPNIMVGLPGEDESTYGRTMEWLKRNKDIISHVNAYNLALYDESELGKQMGAVSQADRDENQQVKSWMVDPEVHKRFSEKLFQFANEQLDQPIGHVTDQALVQPLAKSEGETYNWEQGNCGDYAVALHHLTGHPLYVVRGYHGPDEYETVHAFVSPDGGRTGVDSRGHRSVRDIIRESGFMRKPRQVKAEPVGGVEDLESELGETWPEAVDAAKRHITSRPLAKALDENPPRAASLLVYNEYAQVLWGKRQRDGKWTLPGGHLEPGESPAEGAIRELHEEAGLSPDSVAHFGTANTPDGLPVFMFHATVFDQAPHSGNDPDNEVAEWHWVDCSNGVPPEIRNNLAHARNVIVQHMGW